MSARALRRRNMNKHGHHHHVHALQPTVHRSVDLTALHAAASGPTPALAAAARAPQEVHASLEARETSWAITQDTVVPAWGYEGTVPGPLIVAHAGDTLVAHLVNRLPEPTVIHWHGIRL